MASLIDELVGILEQEYESYQQLLNNSVAAVEVIVLAVDLAGNSVMEVATVNI